nr:hypothetical protein [uncultured Acetatifactor sp.]
MGGTMMVCKNCGTKLSDGLFCPECGTRIDVGYDKEKYGPQGKLEEQKITTKIKLAGTKMVFENKILIFEQEITVEGNAHLEFRNCKFVASECEAILIRGKNVSIDFRNCCFEGEKSIVSGSYDLGNRLNLKFQNSAFIHDGTGKKENYLLRMCGKIYFENCFIDKQKICKLVGLKWKSELEFQNCIITNDDCTPPDYPDDCLILAKNAVVKFSNCFIRCFRKLLQEDKASSETFLFPFSRIAGDAPNEPALINLLIENTYVDTYSYSNVLT